MAAILYTALAACGGATTDAGPGPKSITMSASPASLTLFMGASVTTTITVSRVNYTGALELEAPAKPTGVSVVFSPTSLKGSEVSSTITLTAALDAPFGPGQLVVSATGNGITADIPVQLQVVRPGVIVARGGTGSGTVTSVPAGIDCGTTCSSAFTFGTSVTLTAAPAAGSVFAGWSGNGCSGTSPTCTVTIGAGFPTITATFNSTAPSFSFGLGSGAVNVQQGGSATATATITRVNGFAGAVSFAFSGAPAGLTVSANTAGTADNSATINVAATSALAAGNYPVTVTASSSGFPNQTATLNVQVTPGSGGSGNIAMSFAGCDPSEVPLWVAVQSGTGAWTRVTMGANSTFTFAMGATGGTAIVRAEGPGFSTSVFYGSRDDITTLALGRMCTGINGSTGTQQLSGTLTGIATPLATISLGGAYTEVPIAQGLSFTLNDVPAGRHDLIATGTNVNAAGTRGVARMLLRRDVTYTGTIPQLNFAIGAEGFPPANKLLTTNNLGGDQGLALISFYTANGASAPYAQRPAGPVATLFPSVPDSLLRPGDLHVIQVIASGSSSTAGRVAVRLRRSIVDDTVDLGPPLNQPTVTTLATNPYVRARAQLASQSVYAAAANAEFSQGNNSVGVTVTSGYTAATPTTWTLDVPDLTAAGYDPAWGMRGASPLSWEVFGVAGNILPFFGAAPTDGDRIRGAFASSGSSAASRLARFMRR